MHKIHTHQNKCPDDYLSMKFTIGSPQGNMIIRRIKCEFYRNMYIPAKIIKVEYVWSHRQTLMRFVQI